MSNVFILLDASGSMQSRWNEAITSINNYVKALPETTMVKLISFDTSKGYRTIRDVIARNFEPVSRLEVQPLGGTNLYDSICRMISEAIDRNDLKTIFVSMTDGEENSSQEFTMVDVQRMLKIIESKEWPIVYLGAQFQDVQRYAGSIGINASRSLNINAGTYNSTASVIARKSAEYMSAPVASAATMDFSAEDRTEAAKLDTE